MYDIKNYTNNWCISNILDKKVITNSIDSYCNKKKTFIHLMKRQLKSRLENLLCMEIKKILLSESNYKNHKQGECNFLINCQMTA